MVFHTWRAPGEDDEAGLVPFHFQVHGDPYLGHNQRLAQRSINDWGGNRVGQSGLTPYFRSWPGCKCEIVHILGQRYCLRRIQRSETGSDWCHVCDYPLPFLQL